MFFLPSVNCCFCYPKIGFNLIPILLTDMLGNLSEKVSALFLTWMPNLQTCTLRIWTQLLLKSILEKSSPLLEKLLAWLLKRMRMGSQKASDLLTMTAQMMLDEQWKQWMDHSLVIYLTF